LGRIKPLGNKFKVYPTKLANGRKMEPRNLVKKERKEFKRNEWEVLSWNK